MAGKKTKQASGGARLVASGRRPMTLGLTQEQYELIQAAAQKELIPMTALTLRSVVEASKKILKK